MQGELKRCWAQVEALYPEMMQTLETITGFERGTGNLEGLRQTAGYLAERLKEMGCAITVHEDDQWGPTLVARKAGKGKARVLMFAHMDTVWPAGTCATRKFEVRGSRAYGPGVSDCSHGILCQMFSLKALAALGLDDYGELILLFNPDEEHTSPSSTKWIDRYARISDVAFCMEGADRPHDYISSRAGSAYYELKVKGKKAHAGVNPDLGRNALIELTHKLEALSRVQIPGSYFSISFVNGGVGGCIIPDEAYAMFRFRVDSHQAKAAVDAAVESICKTTYIDGTASELIRPAIGFGPLVKTEEAEKFCALIDATSEEMGYPLNETFCGGGADAVTAQVAGAPTIDGMTPVSYDCHNENESLDLETLVPRIAIMAMVLHRIAADPKYLRAHAEEI